MNTTNDLPDVLTVEDLKEYLRIGRQQAYELANKPNFPSLRIGRSIRIPRNELLKWMENTKDPK